MFSSDCGIYITGEVNMGEYGKNVKFKKKAKFPKSTESRNMKY